MIYIPESVRKISIAILFIIIAVTAMTVAAGCGGSNVHEAVSGGKTFKLTGDSCLMEEKYSDALHYYIKAIKESDRSGDTETLSAATCNTGIVYCLFNDYDKARYYFEKAYRIADSKGYARTASACATNLLLCTQHDRNAEDHTRYSEYCRKYAAANSAAEYWDLYIGAINDIHDGNTVRARSRLRKAHDTATRDSLEEELRNMIYVDIAESWLRENNTDSAKSAYTKALALNSDYSNQKREVFSKLNTIYAITGETDSLAKYQNLLLQLMDSTYNIGRFNRIRNSLDEYEETVVQNDISRARLRFLLMGGVSLLLIILVCVIFRQYMKQRETWKIMRRNYESLLSENEESRNWREKYLALKNSSCSSQEEPESDMSQTCNTLNDELRQKTIIRIMEVIDDGHTVLDPDLSLSTLASQLKINPSYISRAISETYDVNFKTFINKRRIDEVCRRLSDPERYGNYTIAAIAEECGFKSVNNFIVIFKKQVGMSPKKYRELTREG